MGADDKAFAIIKIVKREREGKGRVRVRKVTSVDRLFIKTIGHMTWPLEKQSVISKFNASMTDDRRPT